MTLRLITQLALIGLSIGSLPLIYSAIKGNQKNYQRLVWLVLFCTFDLIIFGAFTRLTDSGLGCPDWPGCYGHSNPLFAMDKILEAQIQMPTGPVTVSKAWIEMIHRYFAMGVGFLMIVLTVTAWLKKSSLGKSTAWLSTILLLLICCQGAFGAWTVTMKLQPIIVTTHLLLALLLLIGLSALTEISSSQRSTPATSKLGSYSIVIPLIGMYVLFKQVFLGAWVSTNYAVLACTDFPLCHGKWIPDMDIHNGFTWWRELGKTATGDALDIQALIAIHWGHRLGALITLTVLTLIYVWVRRSIANRTDEHAHRIRFWIKALGWIAIAQLITGVSNVVLHWPIIAALAHTAGAAALLVCMTKLIFLAKK